GFSLDQFHGEKGPAVGQGAEVVDRGNRRVLQLGDDVGLVEEAAAHVVVVAVAGVDGLESDLALEADLVGAVYHAHAALAQFFQHLVAGDAGNGRRPGWAAGLRLGRVRAV